MAEFDPDAYLSKQSKPAFDPDAYLRSSAKPKTTIRDDIAQGVGDLVSGGVSGAATIGATLLTPLDYLARKAGIQNEWIGRTDRTQATDAALSGLGADTESLAFKGGRLGAQIAGAAGVGGALANGTRMAAAVGGRAIPASVEPILNAIASSGMSTGKIVSGGGREIAKNLLTRSAGGAITGGVSAGLINPSEAGQGAVIGAALPPVLMGAGKVGSAIGGGVRSLTKNTLGLTTGVGAEPISQAFKAGKSGNQAFLDNLRGDVPITDVLDQAKAGLQAMNAAKAAEYRSGMLPIKSDKAILNLDGISKAVDDAASITTFKGQVKNEAAHNAVQKMRAIVDDWKSLDPTEFHTPEGLDALKQKLGGILESIPFEEKTARNAASKIYNATKSEISSQAPTYAKVMKDYQLATEQITEIERALSLGKKASADTSMRKLQSLMRNNVQTNYGNRLSLANALEQSGGVDIMPSLAGQALNSITPRSLSGQIGAGATMYNALLTSPWTLAALPLQSPRLVGSLAYGAGRVAGGAGNALATKAGQANNLARIVNDPSVAAQFGYRFAPVLATDR